MCRIFVEEDIANTVDVAENGLSVDLDQLKINKTYKDALNQFLLTDQVESDVSDDSSEQSEQQSLDTQE